MRNGHLHALLCPGPKVHQLALVVTAVLRHISAFLLCSATTVCCLCRYLWHKQQFIAVTDTDSVSTAEQLSVASLPSTLVCSRLLTAHVCECPM